jgi:hypothetical protein
MNHPAAVSYQGGCACGAVRFRVSNHPRRAGLCHCLTCRKSHGATFNSYAVFARDDFQFNGEVHSWPSSPDDLRWFCPRCGSPVFESSKDEIEIAIGSFDDVNLFTPQYELWVVRRETWQPALDVPQFAHNRR